MFATRTRAVSAFCTGLVFGCANASFPLVMTHYGVRVSMLVQPVASIVILLSLGILAQSLEETGSRNVRAIAGWAWLLIVVVVSTLCVTAFTYFRSLIGREYFFPQLQLLGLLIGLAVAFLGYGLGWLVRVAIKEGDHEEWRPRR
jgi:hypothetical protein